MDTRLNIFPLQEHPPPVLHFTHTQTQTLKIFANEQDLFIFRNTIEPLKLRNMKTTFNQHNVVLKQMVLPAV